MALTSSENPFSAAARATNSQSAVDRARRSTMNKSRRAHMKGDWRKGQSIERGLAMQDQMAASGAPVGTTRRAEDTRSLAEGRIASDDLLANTAAANMEAMKRRREATQGTPLAAPASTPRGQLIAGPTQGSYVWKSADDPVATRNTEMVKARDASSAAAAEIEKSLVAPPGAAPIAVAPPTDRAALLRGDANKAAIQDKNFARQKVEAERQGKTLTGQDREDLRNFGALDAPLDAAPAPAPDAPVFDPSTPAANKLAAFNAKNPDVLTGAAGVAQTDAIAGERRRMLQEAKDFKLSAPTDLSLPEYNPQTHTAAESQASYDAMPKPAAAASAALQAKNAGDARLALLQEDEQKKAADLKARQTPGLERVANFIGTGLKAAGDAIDEFDQTVVKPAAEGASEAAADFLGSAATAASKAAVSARDATHTWLHGEAVPGASTPLPPTPNEIRLGRVPRRAEGGPVEGGKPYLVGEEGPEIIVPKQDGTVIPNPVVNRLDVLAGPTTPRRLQDLKRAKFKLPPITSVTAARG